MELSSRKRLHARFLAEKIQVLELLDQSKMSQAEVARRFRASQLQISFICKTQRRCWLVQQRGRPGAQPGS